MLNKIDQIGLGEEVFLKIDDRYFNVMKIDLIDLDNRRIVLDGETEVILSNDDIDNLKEYFSEAGTRGIKCNF